MTAEASRRRRLIRVAAVLAALIFSLVGSSVPTQAASVPVKGACNPPQGHAPRGEACVYLFFDKATNRAAAQGAVNPRNGHTWRILRIKIIRCNGYVPCTTPVDQGPWPYTTRYQKVSTKSTTGYRSSWAALMTYEVDRDHLTVYQVATAWYHY